MATRTPDSYLSLSDQELKARIAARKRDLAGELVILGHHYQSDAVIEFADERGDSYVLSRRAAATDKRYVVFCGVHFMAEAADILTRDDQVVMLPDLDAGCPMADMASVGEVASAWVQLDEAFSADRELTPVTYINSTAAVKAFCGDKDGIVCTSANAPAALAWALARRPRVFFCPDQHLGRNTALAAGIAPEHIVLWQPNQPLGGNTVESLRAARVILWQGHCHVHTRFSVAAVQRARQAQPDALIAVHSECPHEVAVLADAVGSTSTIIDFTAAAPAGATILVGTEVNLVGRLARQYPDKKVLPLEPSLCPNMFKISLHDLLYVLDNIGQVNVIQVSAAVKAGARRALQNMLSLTSR